jgi:hypothetical protein
MKNIFVSYSRRDTRHMSELREHLLRLGYKPWIDPNPRPGQDWRFAIDDAIRASDAMIVVVSPSAAESVYVTYEWALALGLGIPVIPVIFRDAQMHTRLQTLEHFDMTEFREPEQFWDYFVREIQRVFSQLPERVDQPPMPSPQGVAAPSPLVPPEPFTRSIMPTQPGYYLVVRRGPQLNKMFLLAQDTVTVGRDAKNDITLDDPEVSRFHLKLVWQGKGQGYAAEDLGSTNGTRINGGQMIRGLTPLQAGQALMLGDAIILSYEVVPSPG